MEVKQHYDSLAERQTIVAHWEAQGYRMLHDDFDPDWKRGDEPHGVMAFTDVIEPTIIPEPVRDLAAELDQLKVEVMYLKEKVGIK